jgi:peptidoglycan-N-acetylglucosamine deacetylase
MQKMLMYLAALIILGCAAFFIWSKAPRIQEPITLATSTQGSIRMTVEEKSEETDTYSIRARYPQFGVASIDALITREVEEAISAFKAYPANPPESAVPKNEMAIDFNGVYTGSDFISVEMMVSEYTGGAHPNSVIYGITIDRASGKELTLDGALALLGKSLSAVAAESLAKLRADLGEDMLFPEGAAARPENYSVFIVSENDVTFIFNNYQVAPYAAGPQRVSFARAK